MGGGVLCLDGNTDRSGYYGIILTCNKYHENMSEEEAKKIIKTFLDALRNRAKLEEKKKTGNGWKYWVFVGFSKSNQKVKKERPHFHVVLLADPAWRVCEWVNNYWNPPKKSKRERIGIVKRPKLEPKGVGFFTGGYIAGQADFIREQRLGM